MHSSISCVIIKTVKETDQKVNQLNNIGGSMSESILVDGFKDFKHKVNLLDTTIVEYTQYIERFIAWLEKEDNPKLDKTTTDTMLASVTKKISQNYIFFLREGLKFNTVKKIKTAIQQLYNFIVMELDLLGNCFNGVQVPKDSISYEKSYMTQFDGDRMFNSCESTQHRIIIGLMLYMGLRIKESSSIKIDKIDINQNRIVYSEYETIVADKKFLIKQLPYVFTEINLKDYLNESTNFETLCLTQLINEILDETWTISEDIQNWIYSERPKRILILNKLILQELKPLDNRGTLSPMGQIIERVKVQHYGFYKDIPDDTSFVMYVDTITAEDYPIILPFLNTSIWSDNKII